jgi:hypothetical protein
MKIMFKRVGADTGRDSGKRLSPLFSGNFFHFVTLPGHVDPEVYYTFSYGDCLQSPRTGGANSTALPLKQLRREDVLVLYAGFRGHEPPHQISIGIFAYIVVQRAYIIDHKKLLAWEFSAAQDKPWKGSGSQEDYTSCVKEFRYMNPHVNPEWSDIEHILICGNVKMSRMLSKVESLAVLDGGEYRLKKPVADQWGLKPESDFKRNMPRQVAQAKVGEVWERLRELP